MAENADVMEIPPEDEKESFENSKIFVENVLSTLKNPKIFRRNIGGRKKWGEMKNLAESGRVLETVKRMRRADITVIF